MLKKINQQLKRIEIKEFEIENQIVFNYFDNLPASERDEKIAKSNLHWCVGTNGRPDFIFSFKNIQRVRHRTRKLEDDF